MGGGGRRVGFPASTWSQMYQNELKMTAKGEPTTAKLKPQAPTRDQKCANMLSNNRNKNNVQKRSVQKCQLDFRASAQNTFFYGFILNNGRSGEPESVPKLIKNQYKNRQ